MKLFNNTQDVLGIVVNGLQIQVAHMRCEGHRLSLLKLEQATLVNRLNEKNSRPMNVPSDDILGLGVLSEPDLSDLALQDTSEPESNREVFLHLFNKFPMHRCALAISLMETCVFYTHTQIPEGLKGKKRKRHLIEQIQKERPFSETLPGAEQCAFFDTEPNKVLSVAHEDPLELLSMIDVLKPFMGNVPIVLIDTVEIALINLVQKTCAESSGVVAIVYVGEDFSRIIFMKDGTCLALSQPIHEGFRSPDIMRILCSRMLYEQDITGITTIHRIVLTGACSALNAHRFFERDFAHTQVGYLSLTDVDLGHLNQSEITWIPAFAVPIGLASKALCPKDRCCLPSNFLPKTRRRQQNPFEIAWHGLLLLAALLASTLFFGIWAQDQYRQINALHLSIELLNEQILAGNAYVSKVDTLKTHIQDYEQNFALIDSLSTQKRFWNAGLQDMATAVQKTGHLWLRHFATTEGGIDVHREVHAKVLQQSETIAIAGVASRLSCVPKLANQLGKGNIQSTTRSEIRDATIYEFNLKTPVFRFQ
jgi:Tfp pilus assembly protein PilN